MSGTSMATPHIAGLAALLFQAKPGATVDQIEDAIFKSCILAPGMVQERAGRGVPNGPQALSILTGVPIPPAGAAAPKRRKASGRPAKRTAKKKG